MDVFILGNVENEFLEKEVLFLFRRIFVFLEFGSLVFGEGFSGWKRW